MKEKIGWIIAAILLILIIGFFSFNYVSSNYYEKGHNSGVYEIAYIQTTTGNILLINNGNLTSYPINQICGDIQ